MSACAAGAYPASPTPTSERDTSSCQKLRTVAPSAVHTLHNPTPNAMTAGRDFKSPSTPSGRAASDSTIT